MLLSRSRCVFAAPEVRTAALGVSLMLQPLAATRPAPAKPAEASAAEPRIRGDQPRSHRACSHSAVGARMERRGGIRSER